jgi:Na+/H+ antiporter NhaD/arsenite permease-like protein
MTTESLLAIGLFFIAFLMMQWNVVGRNEAMLGGAAAFLLLGWAMDFYTIPMAMGAIYFDTLAMIFGMSLVSNVLIRSGVFTTLGLWTARFSRGSGPLILVLFVLITYAISSVINNLATMLVMVPLTLVLCQAMRISPIPIVAAELIASNLGGASTLIGDFPNMIIGAAAQLHFDDFIGGMMVPCLLLLAVMLLVFQWRKDGFAVLSRRSRTLSAAQVEALFLDQAGKMAAVDPYLLRVGLVTLAVMLLGLMSAEPLGLRPAAVAFAAGLLMLVLGRIPPHELTAAVGGGDILFFVGEFVMVGGLQAAGVLNGIHDLIVYVGGGSALVSLIVMMWFTGIATPFLNAGPTTALMIPIAEAMTRDIPGNTVWWALSLGVLAGSSSMLSGATAGPVIASQMAYHVSRVHRTAKGLEQADVAWLKSARLTCQQYLPWGIPMALTFLCLSTLYIVVSVP